MNNSFSFSRLGLLIKKQWFDNAKLYSLSVLALIGLLSIIFIFWAIANESRYDEEDTYVIFLVLFFGAGLIFASTTFGALSDKAKGTYWLSIPATHTEKLLCGICYSLIAFPVVFAVSFFIIQQITFFAIRLNPHNIIEPVRNLKDHVIIFCYIFLALQSLFILGSVYFERYAFIKTILAALFIIFLFMLAGIFFAKNLLPHNSGMRGLTSFVIYGDNEMKLYRLAPWIEDAVIALAKFIWAPVFWVATYFRLKEKEI
ncbi:hypothetical protein [Agriterribacter sp.]|uniref:hypothetical protein n=1 Tax=Agriterribacter sp. TaxID=2821509 RepID=UPI002D105980|nr:hypothetical protein [Agriterribacter sp.]HRO45255.1 hypothetical protein [Agriterribacter sp.]HRP57774.1 hypothetical protein [Agriterribacter sp.]HRQ16858.1 hypothetical protein [Agriterribacter sp.]